MSALIGADWKVGDKVFLVMRRDVYGDDVGYIATITATTPTRVKVGDRAWTRDGRPYGDHWMFLRPLQDGDEARDAAWREKVRAEKEERHRAARADALGHLDWREWRALPAEQVETIHGWLAAAGVEL